MVLIEGGTSMADGGGGGEILFAEDDLSKVIHSWFRSFKVNKRYIKTISNFQRYPIIIIIIRRTRCFSIIILLNALYCLTNSMSTYLKTNDVFEIITRLM